MSKTITDKMMFDKMCEWIAEQPNLVTCEGDIMVQLIEIYNNELIKEIESEMQ